MVVRALWAEEGFTATNFNTNGISQSFTSTTQTTSQYAEPVPVGLAKMMWTSWQNLAIEGSFQNVEAVIGSTQAIAGNNCLNFKTGPDVNWSAVNAIIQKLSGDIAKGISNIAFGAPLRLTGNELIQIILATRFRITTIDLAYVFGGAITAGAGSTRFARKHHARHSEAGEPHQKILTIATSVNPNNPPTPDQGGSITFDPSVIVQNPAQPPTAPIVAFNSNDILTISARNPQGT
jgi:hypothetical protein